MPSPQVWFARETRPTRGERIRMIRSRSTLAPAQSASSNVGLSDLFITQHNVMDCDEGAKAVVIDEIADLLADAIWADLFEKTHD
jgi:hypothetical protein